jgi:hypothetical protein
MLDGHGQVHNIEPGVLDINILSNYFYEVILTLNMCVLCT